MFLLPLIAGPPEKGGLHLEDREGKRNGDDDCGYELEVRRFHPGNCERDGYYGSVYHRAQDDRGQYVGEVVLLPQEEHLPDYYRGEADDYRPLSHVHERRAVVELGDEVAGKSDKSVGNHETEDCGPVCVYAKSPRHMAVISGSPYRTTDLGAEEPIEYGDQKRANGKAYADGYGVRRGAVGEQIRNNVLE